jgi:hypothetical protein
VLLGNGGGWGTCHQSRPRQSGFEKCSLAGSTWGTDFLLAGEAWESMHFSFFSFIYLFLIPVFLFCCRILENLEHLFEFHAALIGLYKPFIQGELGFWGETKLSCKPSFLLTSCGFMDISLNFFKSQFPHSVKMYLLGRLFLKVLMGQYI